MRAPCLRGGERWLDFIPGRIEMTFSGFNVMKFHPEKVTKETKEEYTSYEPL